MPVSYYPPDSLFNAAGRARIDGSLMHRADLTISPPDTHLVKALMDSRAFEHPVTTVEMIETHISWVILTDRYVYKIKKPLQLDFLDFGDIEKRKFYCEEEIRLNRPSAPDIYIDVVPITISDGQPHFGGDGEVLDYAVRMNRFNQELCLDAQLADDKLTIADMKELGQVVAARHDSAAYVDEKQREHQVATTTRFIWDNLRALEGFADEERLASLSAWTNNELQRVEPLLWSRFDGGFVRDCHGDLHLANLVRLPAGITTFDCIEFNSDLRDIDVFCDIAFLVMDLVASERHDLASSFINRYLECTGDYAGIALLDLYFVYRCLVRAKVAAISSQECADTDEQQNRLAEVRRYCDMAWRQATKSDPILIIMSGLSGSGKTWLSGQLMAALPAIRLRSDIERKRLFGISERADSASGIGRGMYTKSADDDVYLYLRNSARNILMSGHNVILDAAFLRKAQRTSAISIADDCGCGAVLLRVDAPIEVLRQRLLQRSNERRDASEANLDILEHQLLHNEAISPEEHDQIVVCNNIGDVDIAAVVRTIEATREPGKRCGSYLPGKV